MNLQITHYLWLFPHLKKLSVHLPWHIGLQEYHQFCSAPEQYLHQWGALLVVQY